MDACAAGSRSMTEAALEQRQASSRHWSERTIKDSYLLWPAIGGPAEKAYGNVDGAFTGKNLAIERRTPPSSTRPYRPARPPDAGKSPGISLPDHQYVARRGRRHGGRAR